jgi:two-component system response regulator
MSQPVDPLIVVLLVEDHPGNVRLTQLALAEGPHRCALHVVADGEQAMAFLRQEGGYAGVPHPDLILLDLNLPRKDGWEVLAEIAQDERLRRIPLCVLTTSEADEDVLRAYDLRANAYLVKSADVDEFLATISSLQGFWLTAVRYPPYQAG